MPSGRIRRSEASALSRAPGTSKFTQRSVDLEQRQIDYIDEAARHYSLSFDEILRSIINDEMGWPENQHSGVK